MSDREAGPGIVDTHLHLDDPEFDRDRDDVLREARNAGVVRFITIGHVPERWESSRALRDRYPDVDFALGVHPQNADTFSPAVARALGDAVCEMRPVAIGETGFDFFRTSVTRDVQERAFRAQAEIAEAERLPIVIHQRNASDSLIEVLDSLPRLAPIVLHSFDATPRLADWAIERGCAVGIGGLATKPAAEELRGLLRRMPVERLVLETDAPYLAPPGARGRRNEPANLRRIAGLLAPLWNLTMEELCRKTTLNASRVFALAGSEPTLN